MHARQIFGTFKEFFLPLEVVLGLRRQSKRSAKLETEALESYVTGVPQPPPRHTSPPKNVIKYTINDPKHRKKSSENVSE